MKNKKNKSMVVLCPWGGRGRVDGGKRRKRREKRRGSAVGRGEGDKFSIITRIVYDMELPIDAIIKL
ncbi:hypothetical protein E2C01_049338 [Portunus trituberculatus]|uniref:Uncharacterized protein n=1 Tax=Portunus trituberculatus TaxID=210409 RepID=A0A5B7GDP0_PORTR|nr:hypothetical protein [Portunus trituberculatus]